MIPHQFHVEFPQKVGAVLKELSGSFRCLYQVPARLLSTRAKKTLGIPPRKKNAGGSDRPERASQTSVRERSIETVFTLWLVNDAPDLSLIHI